MSVCQKHYKRADRNSDEVQQEPIYLFLNVMITIGVVHGLIPRQMIAMFDDSDSKLIIFGAYALKVYLMCFVFVGFQIAGSNYSQAVEKPNTPCF